MAACLIRNPSVEICAMPYPFTGMLAGGQTIILPVTVSQVLTLSPSMAGALVLTDLPNYTGPDDSTNFGPVQFSTSRFGPVVIQPDSVEGAPRTALTVACSNDGSLTASTEQTDVYFNLGHTVTWAAGALSLQRAVRVRAPTYGFDGASTITTAVTFDISGAPVAGANATITNSYAFRVAAGASLFSGSVGIGSAPAASAALTVTSTTQGFLPPRVTTTERNAIASPAAGLIVYNSTTNKINVYTGAAWEVVTSA